MTTRAPVSVRRAGHGRDTQLAESERRLWCTGGCWSGWCTGLVRAAAAGMLWTLRIAQRVDTHAARTAQATPSFGQCQCAAALCLQHTVSCRNAALPVALQRSTFALPCNAPCGASKYLLAVAVHTRVLAPIVAVSVFVVVVVVAGFFLSLIWKFFCRTRAHTYILGRRL